MLFNSLEFVVFFISTTILFFALEHRYRWILLLLSGSVFYMYFSPVYILILYFIIGTDYLAGIYMEKTQGIQRKAIFLTALLSHIAILGFFKYANFFLENVNEVFGQSLPLLKIILPIGLSFHTFQAMSYLIEVYRGNQKAERHLGVYGVYILFYPQIVAGPIERPQNLLHQFYRKTNFSYDNAVSGLRLMLWGLIKKIVIADRLTLFSDTTFTHAADLPGLTILLGILFFSFQIYCDFSGYSDIARGSAKVMGYDLMLNFNYPYHSRTVSEFWSRWHISLSTWFKDYVYIPLGGSRVDKLKLIRNIMVVFVLSGLWHGAAWTFVIWGAINGVYLVFAALTKKYRDDFVSLIGLKRFPVLDRLIDLTFVFSLITVSWVFFRAPYVSRALTMFSKLSEVPANILTLVQTRNVDFLELPGGIARTVMCILLIIFLELSRYLDTHLELGSNFKNFPTPVRWSLYFAGVIMIVLLGSFHNQSFIYFQF